MLDILDNSLCDYKSVRNILSHFLGKRLFIEYDLGRNKKESYDVILKQLYDCVFLVETIETNQIKSFSYADIVTKTIKIYDN